MTAPTGQPGRHWRALGDGHLVCELCPHLCRLAPGETGLCGVRHNRAGQLWTDASDSLAVAVAEPIEKKFIYHLAPGCQTLSFAAPGCNLRCHYCQNWLLSQAPRSPAGPALDRLGLTPGELVGQAVATGCQVLASTFSEPTIFFEFAVETALLAAAAGLANVWKTNGYTSAPALAEAANWLTAVNVDWKAGDAEVHRKLTGGELQPVVEALRAYRRCGVWLEVTTLVIPTLNDGLPELAEMARFIRDELGETTPWHLNRFHPDYRLRHLPPTPPETLWAAVTAAREVGLRYVYTDCASSGPGWSTACPGCGQELVRRAAYRLEADLRTPDGDCPGCGRRWDGPAGWATGATGAT